ncbi:2-succinyl-6-hydroxy-2,4-cyclohexadiene-1-carboxylate synthase [Streptomyces sp. RB5]|uniref:2-succinyl-6-hydroxy-2, 4-cyclohexadiene-1-carboxylate synthase n=1 Tax=Streptomyces smaragdinus TaxID=2585196 RepID=A0A7K0C9H3_9ACTN|nr:alpha/beta fold hydrolase [Streptomyces smaragdinus]MQY10107.1 2-succinyl-6-hydroxy-2,4-cyclohexadiene-1-carboxylate synthase [Streptomyces smaragdinus]
MATAHVNGITVGYDDEGTGAPLLLVHGHPFDRTMWAPQTSAFAARGYRVIAPDLRGFGDTTGADGATDFSDFARDLAALLDFLGVEKAVVGGLSMGGQIVMDFCRLYPERLLGVVLADTFPGAETPRSRADRLATADRLEREGMGPWAEEALDKMVAPYNVKDLPDVADHVRRMMHGAPVTGAVLAHRARAERPDYRDTLRALAVPALVVTGVDDPYTPVADGELMRDLIPDAELCLVEGAAHMPNLERTGEFDAALRRFLARVTLPPVNGYRHAVRARGEHVVVSGQIALDHAGRVVGEGDADAQARQVFRNLDKALTAQGATFADVVKLNIFVTDMAVMPAVRRARDEWIDTANPPASSAVRVSGFIRPELLVEIDAQAVVAPTGQE